MSVVCIACERKQTSCGERVQCFLLGASLHDQRKDMYLCRTTAKNSDPCNSQQWKPNSSPAARTICWVLYLVFTQKPMLPVNAATGQVLYSSASSRSNLVYWPLNPDTQLWTWKDNYDKMTGEMLWGARMLWAERCMLVHPQVSNKFCIR